MQRELGKLLQLICDGYEYYLQTVIVPDYTENKEVEHVYLAVENPEFDPTDQTQI